MSLVVVCDIFDEFEACEEEDVECVLDCSVSVPYFSISNRH